MKMTKLKWLPTMSVGIPSIDAEHNQIITIINNILTKIENLGTCDITYEMGKIIEYSIDHFNHEERLFESHNYLEAPSHIEEHKKFISTMNRHAKKLKLNNDPAVASEVARFLFDWLINHIMDEDQKYSKVLKDGGAQ